jgi:hypothetical protein
MCGLAARGYADDTATVVGRRWEHFGGALALFDKFSFASGEEL